MSSFDDAAHMTPEERKAHVTELSVTSGLAASARTGLISIPMVLLLNKYHAGFRNTFGVSGRTALAISPPLFAFAFVSERVASRLASPESFHTYIKEQQPKLPIHHAMANYVYFHPFKTITMVSVPAVASIFLFKSDEHLKFSQRVMHTRVLGQASVLAILASAMLFHDYMDKRGPYTS